jgi:putative transposase
MPERNPYWYLFGNVLIPGAYHKELLMHEQPQDTLPLAALSPQERTRALERYRMLQPCVEHDVPLTHVARHHGIPLRTAQCWLAQY